MVDDSKYVRKDSFYPDLKITTVEVEIKREALCLLDKQH